MTSIDDFAALVPGDHGLVVVSTLRADSTIQSSVVNGGVLDHPLTGQRVVGVVAQAGSQKLANLRARPRATIVVRAGWRWAGVEGRAELIGPDDPKAGVDVRLLLRDIFKAAGGTHEDYDEYDRVMAEEGRTAVLVSPERVYGS